jgi:hypothetical protein
LLGRGLRAGNRYEVQLRAEIERVLGDPDASPEDRYWAKWYGS